MPTEEEKIEMSRYDPTRGQTVDRNSLVPDRVVALSERHARWIAAAAGAESPPISTTMMLGRVLDEVISDEQARHRQRAEQLEVYRASGYPEHHPDYPDFP